MCDTSAWFWEHGGRLSGPARYLGVGRGVERGGQFRHSNVVFETVKPRTYGLTHSNKGWGGAWKTVILSKAKSR